MAFTLSENSVCAGDHAHAGMNMLKNRSAIKPACLQIGEPKQSTDEKA